MTNPSTICQPKSFFLPTSIKLEEWTEELKLSHQASPLSMKKHESQIHEIKTFHALFFCAFSICSFYTGSNLDKLMLLRELLNLSYQMRQLKIVAVQEVQQVI